MIDRALSGQLRLSHPDLYLRPGGIPVTGLDQRDRRVRPADHVEPIHRSDPAVVPAGQRPDPAGRCLRG
jgi:hypothetical protein